MTQYLTLRRINPINTLPCIRTSKKEQALRDSGHVRSVAGQGDDCADSLLLVDRAGVLVE